MLEGVDRSQRKCGLKAFSVDEILNILIHFSAKKERKTNKKKVKTAERFAGGVDYPYDVWCLIGDHIDPECVAKFGSLCKTAHTVIHSARFWSKMYLR